MNGATEEQTYLKFLGDPLSSKTGRKRSMKTPKKELSLIQIGFVDGMVAFGQNQSN